MALQKSAGELDRLGAVFSVKRSDRMRCTALSHYVAGATFAAPALGSYAKFKLNFIKCHACARMTRNFAIGHSAANADNHDRRQLAGCEEGFEYK